jgi:hypothetical protein
MTGGGIAGAMRGSVTTLFPHDYYFLVSPEIDLSTTGGSVTFSYSRYLNTPPFTTQSHRVEVFDGTQWIVVANATLPTVNDSTWATSSFDVTPYKNAKFRVRFGHALGAFEGNLSASGWNVDNVRIASTASVTTAFNSCAGPWSLSATTPYLGSTLAVTFQFAQPQTIGFLCFGNPTTPALVFGSACNWSLAPILIVPFQSDAAGTYVFPAALPDVPEFAGVSISTQAGFFVGSSFVATNRLDLVLGY